MNVNQLTQETIELMKSAQAGGGRLTKVLPSRPALPPACKPMTFPRRLKNSIRY